MINIVCALRCEARPLIEHYRLQHIRDERNFQRYQNEEIQLIISGLGKLSAATATAWLAGNERTNRAWLNLGIAGHPALEIGAARLTHKITDNSSQQSWYPGFSLPFSCHSEPLVTLDQADEEYRHNCMIDMEASGFFSAAGRFQSCELIHALKIISDNSAQGTQQISEKMVTALIADRLEIIENTVSQLQNLSRQLDQIEQLPESFHHFLEKWHFTTYQQNELRNQLRRWQTLLPNHPATPSEFSAFKNSKAVLNAIKTQLDRQPVDFGEKNH